MVQSGLSPDVASGLDQLGRECGATLLMTRLAAFSALVALDGGSHDVTLDSYLSLRRFTGLQRMIGALYNRAALRLRFSDQLGFRAWLAAVRDEAIEVSRHGVIPFGPLMEELERRVLRRPYGGTTVAVPTEPPPLSVGGLEIETLPCQHIAPWGFSLGVKR